MAAGESACPQAMPAASKCTPCLKPPNAASIASDGETERCEAGRLVKSRGAKDSPFLEQMAKMFPTGGAAEGTIHVGVPRDYDLSTNLPAQLDVVDGEQLPPSARLKLAQPAGLPLGETTPRLVLAKGVRVNSGATVWTARQFHVEGAGGAADEEPRGVHRLRLDGMLAADAAGGAIQLHSEAGVRVILRGPLELHGPLRVTVGELSGPRGGGTSRGRRPAMQRCSPSVPWKRSVYSAGVSG